MCKGDLSTRFHLRCHGVVAESTFAHLGQALMSFSPSMHASKSMTPCVTDPTPHLSCIPISRSLLGTPAGMPSSVQLWEFVLRVLKNPLYNNILSWENQHEGIFHIHDPQALAELWGKHRNHEGMNYDKMSRAMRYYYRRGILEPVRERLTYKFALRLRPMFFD